MAATRQANKNNYITKPPTLCVEMGFTWTFPRNQDATVNRGGMNAMAVSNNPYWHEL